MTSKLKFNSTSEGHFSFLLKLICERGYVPAGTTADHNGGKAFYDEDEVSHLGKVVKGTDEVGPGEVGEVTSNEGTDVGGAAAVASASGNDDGFVARINR